MRLTRVVAGTAALLVTTALPMAGAPRAGAAEKVQREVYAIGVEPEPNLFVVKGEVRTGTYENSRLVMLRKPGGSSAWSSWKTFRTDDTSHFRLRVFGPAKGSDKVCYKVKVPSSATYETSFGPRLCVVRS